MYWKLSILSVFMLVSIFSGACQSKGKNAAKASVQYPIEHIQCYVRFVESKKEIQSEVSFTMKDSTLGVAAYPKKFFFNEQAMAVKNLPKLGLIFRHVHEPTVYNPPYYFHYTELDSSIIKDSINMPKLNNLMVKGNQMSLSKGATLAWDNQLTLMTNDVLRILIIDSKGENYTINHAGATLAGELGISFEQLPNLAKGKATLIISQARSVLGEKISKKIEFYYKEIETEIVD